MTQTKALILAAGIGSRLAPITDEMPKAMVPVNGTPILFQQIRSLLENGISDICVVAGYKAEVMQAALAGQYPAVKVIVNEDYLTTNNMYSAYLGVKAMQGSELVVMNADVFFDSAAVRGLADFPHADAIVVDMGNYIEESMKVVQEGERLVEISKTIPEAAALGCSIDMYRFSARTAQAYLEICKGYIEDKKELKLWSEVALNDLLKTADFRACPLAGRWVEIDDHNDLAQAQAVFAN